MRMRQEKKYVEKATGLENLGQVNSDFGITGSGAFVYDMTPSIPQGDGEGQRIGNSVTATGMVLQQQFIKQIRGIGPRRVKSYLIRTLDPSLSSADVLSGVFDVNPLSGVVDYFSSLNYTMMADKRIQIIGQAQTKILVNAFGAELNPSANERSMGELKIPVKFDDQTLRFATDGDAVPAAVRYYLISICDAGNTGSGTSTAPVFVQAASTGLSSKAFVRLWYTDS